MSRALFATLCLGSLLGAHAVFFASSGRPQPGRNGVAQDGEEVGRQCELREFTVQGPSEAVKDPARISAFGRKLRVAVNNYWHILDVDGDGFATQQELYDFDVLRYGRNHKPGQNDREFYGKMELMVKQTLQHQDLDCDGMLSEAEFLAPHKKRFV